MTRPIVVDIDGTLSRRDRSIEGRVIDAIREWPATVVVATGKAFPYPVALCSFLDVPVRVIAENGGVVCVTPAGAERPERVRHAGEPEAAAAVADAYRDRGHDLGWGALDLVNYWRETEVAVSRDRPLDVLREVAAAHDQVVVDTGYAYHVTSPDVDKGVGLVTAAAELDVDPDAFVAVGDSENDAALFDTVGRSFAVANADETARAAADVVLEESYADGFLAAVERVAGERLS